MNKRNEATAPTMEHMPPQFSLLNLTHQIILLRCLYLATKYQIAVLLEEGPQTIAELASKTKLDAKSLYRVIRTLATIGIFHEDGSEKDTTDFTQIRISQTPKSALLSPNTDGSMYAWVMMTQSQYQWDAWSNIEHSIKTGKPALEMPYFDYLTQHPQEQDMFTGAMSFVGSMINQPVLDALIPELANVRTFVDVGGGQVGFIQKILDAYLEMQGILFDRPKALEQISPSLLHDRLKLEKGDFFSSVPAGGDVYFLKQILQDWSDEACLQILTNCHKAMHPDARIIVAESILYPNDHQDIMKKIIDLEMLLVNGGSHRTENEMRLLFNKAGLKVNRFIPTQSMCSLVEGVKA